MSLSRAEAAIISAREIVDSGLSYLKSKDNPEDHQVFLYDLAHANSALAIAESFLLYADKGNEEKEIVEVFLADSLRSIAGMSFGREETWGISKSALENLNNYVSTHGTPQKYSQVSSYRPRSHLNDELELVAETFRRFGNEHIEHHAEKVHREDLDVPEEIINGLSLLGCFGLSIP